MLKAQMTITEMEQIVIHQVKISLKEKGLSRSDLNDLEYTKLLFQMSLKLLVELNND